MDSKAVCRLSASPIAVAVIFLAGCGGGGGGASEDIEASVNKFIKDGDCSATTERYRKSLTGETDVKECSHDLSLRNEVKSLSIGKVTSSGDSGTAAVTTDGDEVVLKVVKQDGDWLIDGDEGAEKADSSESETSTSTDAPADSGADVRSEYAAALVPYQAGRKTFEKTVLEDIQARNLAAVKGDFSKYRDVVYAFDGSLRKIDFPAGVQTEVTALLTATRNEIASLDAVNEAPSFAELQRLLSTKLKDDDNALTKAVRELSRAL